MHSLGSKGANISIGGKLRLSSDSANAQNIRIYHVCEDRIEISVPRIAVRHHEAYRVMTNGDPEENDFLSYPHTNNGFVFLLTTVFSYLFIYLFIHLSIYSFIYFKISFQKSLYIR